MDDVLNRSRRTGDEEGTDTERGSGDRSEQVHGSQQTVNENPNPEPDQRPEAEEDGSDPPGSVSATPGPLDDHIVTGSADSGDDEDIYIERNPFPSMPGEPILPDENLAYGTHPDAGDTEDEPDLLFTVSEGGIPGEDEKEEDPNQFFTVGLGSKHDKVEDEPPAPGDAERIRNAAADQGRIQLEATGPLVEPEPIHLEGALVGEAPLTFDPPGEDDEDPGFSTGPAPIEPDKGIDPIDIDLGSPELMVSGEAYEEPGGGDFPDYRDDSMELPDDDDVDLL